MEPDDVDGYFAQNSWRQYEDELVEEMISAFSVGFSEQVVPTGGLTLQQRAAEWARVYVGPDLDGIQETTKNRVRDIVATSIEAGQSLQQTIKQIRQDKVFGQERAATIAQTQTTTALGQGALDAAVVQGQNQKKWVTIGITPGLATDECVDYQSMSRNWIDIDAPFVSASTGRQTKNIPAHPNCRCVISYRTKEIHDPNEDMVQAEFRCPSCNRLLGKVVRSGTRILCRHCKAERIA